MTPSLKVTKSSGNVFADLGIPHPVSQQTKVDLAVVINAAIKARGLRQRKTADLLGATQPQVSCLANYRLSGFSVGRLVDFLVALGHEVDIRHWPTKDGTPGQVGVRGLEMT